MRRLAIALLIPVCALSVERGRRLYNEGHVEGRELMAMLRGSATEIPARLMTCASCHGSRGEGTTEAGVHVPPLKSSFSETELSPCGGRGHRKGWPKASSFHAVVPADGQRNIRSRRVLAFLGGWQFRNSRRGGAHGSHRDGAWLPP